jgi:putative membrane protein
VYDVMMTRPLVHVLVHVPFVASGWLFAWVVAGPDPAPRRPSVPARLVVLAVAIALHACIAQLMYGGFLIDIHAPIHQVQGGADIMYFGGDIAELLLTAVLVAGWRPVRRPRSRGRDARSPAAFDSVP